MGRTGRCGCAERDQLLRADHGGTGSSWPEPKSGGIVAAPSSLRFVAEIGVDQLDVALAAEAGEVAAVHGAHGEAAQPLHAADVVVDVGMIGVVDEGAVVHGVAGEQNSS